LNIHVINLDRSVDRLNTFQSVNGHVAPHILRFSAIEGRSIQRAAYVERGVISADLHYTDGALGIALSHFALWDLAINSKAPVTICEDDAIFNHLFREASDSLLSALPADWHIVLWGWNFSSVLAFDMMPNVLTCVCHFDQEMMRKGTAAFQAASLQPRPFKLQEAFGMVCYSVSPEGARLLRQFCLPLRNMSVYIRGLQRAVRNMGIDVLLNRFYARLNGFVSFPPLVITPNDRLLSTHRNPDGSLKA
jgi:glycosyl transferase, family 25